MWSSRMGSAATRRRLRRMAWVDAAREGERLGGRRGSEEKRV